MNYSLLFAASPEVTSWLTPIWILGMGVTLGLVILLVIWGVCTLLSRIPVLGELNEVPSTRNFVALGIAIVAVVIFAPLYVSRVGDEWTNTNTMSLVFIVLGSILAGYLFVVLVSRRTIDELPIALNESVLLWIFVLMISVAGLGLASTLVVQEPTAMIQSLFRIPKTGTLETQPVTLPEPRRSQRDALKKEDIEETEVAIEVDGAELISIEFRSSNQLEVAAKSFTELDMVADDFIEVPSEEDYLWQKSLRDPIVPNKPISKLYIRNLEQSEAELSMTIFTAPEYPEMATIPQAAFVVVAIFLAYILQRSLLPKLSAVALSTCKSEIAQPMFLVLMTVGALASVVFIYVPYHTFGEDIKMLKDSGLTLILIFAIIQAVWAASKSVADEIEGRTALTVLSKPIARHQFIIGKFIGIVWTIALMFIVLGFIFLIVVAYKPVYDEYEGGALNAEWQECHREMIKIVPGLALAFMEAVVLAALSVALSTRLPMVPNFLTCIMIYVLGHLVPMIVNSAVGDFEIVRFFGQFIATVLPVLDHFNIQAAVAGGAEVPMEYLQWSLLYCLIYGTIAMLLGLVMFEDRDLA